MENNENLNNIVEKLGDADFEDTFTPGVPDSKEPEKKEEKKEEEQSPVETKQEEFEVPDDSFKTDDDGGEEKYFNNVYDSWRELGLLKDAPELDKDRVLTNDELISIIEENNRNAAKKMFEDEFMSKFADDDAQEYLRYVLGGGDSKTFFRQRMESPAIGIDGDISNSSVQDNVIATYLSKFAGLDQGEIAEQIQMLTDAGKKEKYARMYLDKIHQYDEAQKESMRRENEMREKQERENYQRVVQSFSDELKTTESIFGTRCDDSRRAKIMDMMFKPLRMQDGSTNTEFNVRLYNAMQDPKKAIILADMLANDFDMAKYSKSLETQAVRKIRAGLDSKPNIKKNQTSPFDNLFNKK